MKNEKRSIVHNLAANSALIAVLVIAASEVIALLRRLFSISENSAGRVVPGQGDTLSINEPGTSTVMPGYENRRGELPSRRHQMFKLSERVETRGRRERRAMRGRRASDFATFGMSPH